MQYHMNILLIKYLLYIMYSCSKKEHLILFPILSVNEFQSE